MRAMTVTVGKADSAELGDVPEPPESDGSVLVEGLLTGICGTDIELVSGEFGTGRPGSDRLVIGHESLGQVLEAPEGSGFSKGDLVAGVVRRPDPVPCPACARGEWDFCRNGRYTERGIKELDGYGAERWRVDPYVLDRAKDGPKPEVVRALGATYLSDLEDLDITPDVVIEATGAGQLVVDCATLLGPAGIMCLTGVSHSPATIDVPIDALNRQLVVRNAALVGSVNAAKRHYADAVDVLMRADRSWLERLMTRTVPLSDWPSALVKQPDDVKVVVDLRA